MKISYTWLKDYIDYLPSPEETAAILTSIGLEVENIEDFSSIRGGLQGVVVGEVLSTEKHPDADKLTLTKVNTGTGELLSIVCGAPNVKTGQKVPVASIGTILYKGKESFTIQKSKIRGQLSEGMICAEDELGLGDDHSGIMVLDPSTKVGIPAAEYFEVYKDAVFEIGITPNRIDGASHYGVARDLAAFLAKERKINLKRANIETFTIDNKDLKIEVLIENHEGCKRYSGLTITGVKVEDSPRWLQNRLKAIGLKPINNVVDITNFVLHETGQPLHAFDADKVTGGKVIVKTLPENTPFAGLDEVVRKLSSEDLMICNTQEGMCIAGVFGGYDSGVKETTKNIFLESACFNPVFIRKTSKRHMLYTDSSFRFERGSDPNITLYALKRAALLIREITGGKISSEVVDVYPEPVQDRYVYLGFKALYNLTGHEITTYEVLGILKSLDIKVKEQTPEGLHLSVPPYRVDVTRPADVIEEILRIYGFNNIPVPENMKTSLSFLAKPDKENILSVVSDLLASSGFNEIMSNSLTKSSYFEYEDSDNTVVKIYNPLSSDLNAMRKTLLFGGLEAIAYNTNRQNPDLRLFEFGNIYSIRKGENSENKLDKYLEEERMALFLTGENHDPNWASDRQPTNFFHIKAFTELILKRLGFVPDELETSSPELRFLEESFQYSVNGTALAVISRVQSGLIKQFDIKNEVYYTEIHWNNILKSVSDHRTLFTGLPRYPEVNRDLSMILERSVKYEDIKKVAKKAGGTLLKKINLFDVYEGGQVGSDKKSYAISFTLRDENKTLTDTEIDTVMDRIARKLEKEIGVQIRK